MMKLRIWFFTFCICLFFLPDTQAEQDGVVGVSLINLLATPEDYVGREVLVKGFLESGLYSGLYTNHLSAEIMDWPSSIFVHDSTLEGDLTSSCKKKYVAIKGRFVEIQKRYELVEVVEVWDIKKKEPCWDRQDQEDTKESVEGTDKS